MPRLHRTHVGWCRRQHVSRTSNLYPDTYIMSTDTCRRIQVARSGYMLTVSRSTCILCIQQQTILSQIQDTMLTATSGYSLYPATMQHVSRCKRGFELQLTDPWCEWRWNPCVGRMRRSWTSYRAGCLGRRSCPVEVASSRSIDQSEAPKCRRRRRFPRGRTRTPGALPTQSRWTSNTGKSTNTVNVRKIGLDFYSAPL